MSYAGTAPRRGDRDTSNESFYALLTSRDARAWNVKPYILVVDDEIPVLKLVSFLVEDAGYEARTASSALDALATVRTFGPPVAGVIDVAMPKLSGLDLVRLLRARSDTAAMPVVFLSAKVFPSDIAAGVALGARYVTKPFEPENLIAVMEAEIPDPPTEPSSPRSEMFEGNGERASCIRN